MNVLADAALITSFTSASISPSLQVLFLVELLLPHQPAQFAFDLVLELGYFGMCQSLLSYNYITPVSVLKLRFEY